MYSTFFNSLSYNVLEYPGKPTTQKKNGTERKFYLTELYDTVVCQFSTFQIWVKTEWWPLLDCGDLDDKVITAKVSQSPVSLRVGYR